MESPAGAPLCARIGGSWVFLHFLNAPCQSGSLSVAKSLMVLWLCVLNNLSLAGVTVATSYTARHCPPPVIGQAPPFPATLSSRHVNLPARRLSRPPFKTFSIKGTFRFSPVRCDPGRDNLTIATFPLLRESEMPLFPERLPSGGLLSIHTSRPRSIIHSIVC